MDRGQPGKSPTTTGERIDSVVDFTLTLLETGSDAFSEVPVPGLTAAVTTLTLILTKIKVRRFQFLRASLNSPYP